MTIEKLKELFKFSWAQALSDHCGKSSILLTAGWYMIFTGGLVLMWGAICKDANIMMSGIAWGTIGAGLLGYKKSVDGKSGGEFPSITEDGSVTNTSKIEQVTTITEETNKPPN